jgi:hypothetical protein
VLLEQVQYLERDVTLSERCQEDCLVSSVEMNEISRPLDRWVSQLVGKDAQPLQSVKLVYQSCSRSRAAHTLTCVTYGIKLNMSIALH